MHSLVQRLSGLHFHSKICSAGPSGFLGLAFSPLLLREGITSSHYPLVICRGFRVTATIGLRVNQRRASAQLMQIKAAKNSCRQRTRLRRLFWLLGSLAPVLALALALTACVGLSQSSSSHSTPSNPTPPAPTASIALSPTSIDAGQQASLTWQTTDATHIFIEGIGSVQPNGSQRVTASASTIYHLTATGPGGTQQAKALLTVTQSPPPPSAAITVSPTSIRPGESASLTWHTTNATDVSIDGMGLVQLNGTRSVTPGTSKTYHLTANGAGGTQQVTALLTVTQSPPPPPPPGPTITEAFFGMHMHTGILGQQPWPQVSFGGLRLWNTGTAWAEINTSNQTYDWSVFDQWLAAADAHGISNLLYTFARTPAWASSHPGDPTCAYGPGQCWPPRDLNSDGTGANQYWKAFVTALAAHNASKSGVHVKYWEIWNEFDQAITWRGTNAQLVRMAQDARRILLAADPNAIVLTPSSSTGLTATASQMQGYLATPGASSAADAIAIHPYVQQGGVLPVPEDVLTLIGNVKNILSGADAAKPIWSTEGSWGVTTETGFTDPDQQAAFTARYLLLQQSAGIASFYWYEWNNTTDGTFWYPAGTHGCTATGGCITPAGSAYQQVYQWTAGATLASPCSATGTIWKCQFTRANGYLGQAVWDASQTCQDGLCRTSQFSIDGKFIHYRDLTGAVTDLNAATTVPIGSRPILLENQ